MGGNAVKYRAKVPLTPRERLALEVYDRVDDAVRRELARLRREEGIVASCHRGCSRCCGQHIQMNPSEAHAMGQYIKRTFSGRQIRDLERRTEQWHAREDAQRKRHSSSAGSCGAGPSDDGLSCPLLVGRACSAYPVRPVICRTHFVSSDPSACLPACVEPSGGPAPVVLASIPPTARPFVQRLRTDIEAAGVDFSRSILLLPHWLAIEMDWPFDTD